MHGLVHMTIPLGIAPTPQTHMEYIARRVSLCRSLGYGVEVRSIPPDPYSCILTCWNDGSITSIEVILYTEYGPMPNELVRYLLHDVFILKESSGVRYVPLRITLQTVWSRSIWGCVKDDIYKETITQQLSSSISN